MFPPTPGMLQFLDREHNGVGERFPCTFAWEVKDDGWAVVILEQHELEMPGGDVYYLAIYGGSEGEELMFTLPFVGRPKQGRGTMSLGRRE
jgi:hypothetical protein